jgi:hypothetical protein
MQKIQSIIKTALLALLMHETVAAGAIANHTFTTAFYDQWHPLTIRQHIPKPLTINTDIQASRYLSFAYQVNYRRFYHDMIAINFGASLNAIRFVHRKNLSATLYPELRINFLPHRALTPFISYSLGGLSLQSQSHIDGYAQVNFKRSSGLKTEATPRLIFKDFLGIGISAEQFEVALRLTHLSDWIMSKKSGFDVPYVIVLGYHIKS